MSVVAIVDDDPIVCQSLATILTATGTADVPWTANDGDEAVRRYFETPSSRPDVLLIDIQMPVRDGLSAAKEILGRDPAARILFLTTFADRSYIAQAVALGARGYLIKQDVASVGPAIQAVMAGQVVLGADVLGRLTQGDRAPGASHASVGAAATPGHGDVPHAPHAKVGIGGAGREGRIMDAGNALTDCDASTLKAMLNERDRDIAALVAKGYDNRDIAHRLYLSEGTVRNRISGMLDKLGLTNRTQLAILWINAHR